MGLPPTQPDFLEGLSTSNIETAATSEFNDFTNFIVFTSKGNLQELFSSRASFPRTSNMAEIMGTGVWSAGAPFTAPNHPGLLTKPYLHLVNNPSAKLVQRGKKIRINMLCTDVPMPSPADLAGRPSISEQDLIQLNRRDYIDKATLGSPSCVVCHSRMNQLGFATENYDSLGRFITTEKIFNSNNQKVAQHPVVSSSKPTITENDTRTFNNVQEFQTALASSDSLQQCLTRKTYQYFLNKPENISQDSCRLNKMDNVLKKNKPLLEFFVENFKQPSMLYKRSQ